MLTDEQLQEIEARCEAATPGPWEGDNGDVYTGWSREEYADERGYKPQGTGFSANADFIAHARTDIPALLAHIRELEAEKARLRRAFEHMAENIKKHWKRRSTICPDLFSVEQLVNESIRATKEAPCPK